MTSAAERDDPLRARPSRVEKPRRPKKTRKDLPAWFYRVAAIVTTQDRDTFGFDYDEDLSELEDTDDNPDHCSNPVSCHCDSDEESERSYEGEDADYYYGLKREREQRKRQKLEESKENDEEREFQRAQEDKFNAAYEALKTAEQEGKTIPVESLHKQSYQLFCSEAVDYLYNDIAPMMTIDFNAHDPSNPWCGDPDYHTRSPEPDEIREAGVRNDEAGIMHGSIYLNMETNCDFGPFRPRKTVSREVITMSSDEGDKLSLGFIGNGFLRLTLSREMVFTRMDESRYSKALCTPPSPPPDAPEVFEFIGTLRDFEKEEAERKARMQEELARRPRSPRETMFGSYGWF